MCSRKWLKVTLVACALVSACSDYNTNLSVQTSSSTLTFVSPSTATVGGAGFTITANGSGFTTGALILWNGTALTTTLVSATQLTAPVPAANIATAGTVKVSVQIPGSAQSATQNVNNTTTTEISNIVLFTINTTPGTPPAVTSLSASTTSAASTPYCSTQGFTLTVNGANFTSDAVVDWNGAAQTTTFVSATQLTGAIPATNAAFPGKASVAVTNSLGTSNSLPITLSTPGTGLAAPSIGSLSLNSAPVGSSDVALTVTGTNILPCSVVQWVSPGNVTSNLATTFVSATQLTATIPAADFLAAGTAQVQVFTLTPGGGTSTQIPFSILAPSIGGLSSSTTSMNTTPSCSPSSVTLTVTGLNFVNSSVVDWIIPGTPPITTALATTFVSSTQLTAVIPISNTASAGSVNIAVSNLGALSNQLAFTISASSPPAATIGTPSPASATAGAAALTLTVSGTNLLPCSVVEWSNGGTTTPLATTYIAPTQTSAAQLTAILPAAEIAAVSTTAQVSVATPASSTNLSNFVSFPVSLAVLTSLSASTTSSASTPYCSSSGFTLTVNGTGFANDLVVNWNGSPRPTTLVSATQLNAAITPADTAFLASGTGAAAITVSGGIPGTNSNSLKFALTALTGTASLPHPALSSISPTNAALEALTGPAVPLTLNGSGISPCSMVQWNGASLPVSIFIGTSGMASVIPAANITATGMEQVTVATPAPGGGTSGGQTFQVYMPGTPGSNKISGAALSLPLMSADQRYTVYVLASVDGTTEVAGSTQNIFVNDTCFGVASGCTPSMTLISAGLSNAAANGDSVFPAISGDAGSDGRYVSFLSSATNLVSGVTNGVLNAYVRDTCTGAPATPSCIPTTQLVSVATGGTQANGATTSATIDATGRYIIFESTASNLGAVSSSGGIFLRDTCAGILSGCTASTQPLN